MASGDVILRTLIGGVPSDLPAKTALAIALPVTPVAARGVTGTVADFLDASARIGHTAVADQNYQALTTDVHIGFTALTAARTVTLCDVDLYPLGQDFVIVDETGACSDSLTITAQVGNGTGDTIPQTSSNTIVLASPYASLRLRRGASNVWLIVS